MIELTDEMNFQKIRSFTPAQRRANVAAFKACEAAKSGRSEDEVEWHLVDDPMTPPQWEALPDARDAEDTRTSLQWVKFVHHRTGELTVSKGYYDHDGGSWAVQIEMEEDGWHYGQVDLVAWASITSILPPWNGPMVREG